MKRFFDFIVSLLAGIFCLPIFSLLIISIRLKLGSPVFFKQARAGRFGKPFVIYKFRSMNNKTGPDGLLLPDHERLTPFGQWLRKTSLDELPQLWNVLKGDLSLVGPRPLLMEYNSLYNEEQALRLTVKPGITGWAQVNGRNAISWEEKFELDVWYVRNRSFWLDLKILWLTVKKVFQASDINQTGHVTMPKFEGTSVEGTSK
ncbi:MAG: sugar transferase [Cohnella sp.]|uniref:sugar transferase n=1 Tax=Cohnella sp. TaxID=1883426 RepID=UPI000E38153F|nr:sugar transferase [Cohnella sp.]REK66484.1 MAG: sugar transferase [Cohnella sp.]